MRILFLAAAVFSVTSAQYFREPEKVISDSRNVGDRLGKYSVAYETDGGILQKEFGSRKYEGTPDEAQLIQGSVQYISPEGESVSLSWTADEFGSQIVGSHIPTPPPIPPEIQRALEWLKKQPSTTEENYDAVTEAPKESRLLEAEKKIAKDPKFRNQFRRN